MRPHIKKNLEQSRTRTTNLQLTSGRLDKLPEQVIEFEMLKYLDLFDNNLSKLPDNFYKLSAIEHLSLNSNRFDEIPSIIFLLPNLKVFNSKSNRITTLNGEKCINLLKIRKVDLSHNNITYFPKSDKPITYEIEEFSLKGNKLLKFPEGLKQASTLKKLDLSENKIENLSDDDFEAFINLEELDLSYNKLTYLPTSIGKLTKLKVLNLSGNKISYLPSEIENLTSLEKLSLSGNPIERAPIEIEAQGSQGIINYYLSLGENVKLYEAKLLIVGQGNVGKTFLMNRLVYDQTPETNTTEGIEINAWNTKTESTDNFRINIWDFGGQEIYHSTHQFFLTKRSLYLLVWEARTDQHLISFDYWLNIIRLLSNDSPTLVVLNKIDERIISIDEKSLKEKFKNIRSFHQVSTLEGTNIEALSSEIRKLIDELPLIGDRLPKVWIDIRQELELLEENFINLERYLLICNRHGLSNKKALLLSQYFHDLGVFLHFQESPLLRNLVFLKPEWATNAVYKIMDSKTIISNNGEFLFSELENILSDYPSDKYLYLIELMKKFELCFQLNSDNKYLVTELLKPEKISFDWDYTDNLRFEYHYDFMPAGILPRFIVRVKDMVEGNAYWKNGVIIHREASQALIISDQYSRKISIWVNGGNKPFLLEIIRREIDQINETLNYNTVPEKIPCNCPRCINDHSPHLFNYQFVKHAATTNSFRTIHCEKSFKGVNVNNLIGLYVLSEPEYNNDIRYDSDTILFDLKEISSRILERKHTKKIEDLLNDDIVDLLRTKGHIITDQTRSGSSGSDVTGAGELDIMIRSPKGLPISIIECFRLESCGPKNDVIGSHIDKLLHKYDTHGLKRNFIIVFSEAKNFSNLWDNYVAYLNDLNNHDSFSAGYPFANFRRRPDLTEGITDLKIGIAEHEREGETVEVVHILLNLSTAKKGR